MERKSQRLFPINCVSLLLKRSVLILITFITMAGCKKMIAVSPPINSVTAESVFESDVMAASVLNGLYIDMRGGDPTFEGTQSISLTSGLSADELSLVDPSGSILTNYYQNSFTRQNVPYWAQLYNYLLRVNSAIEGISKSDKLTTATRQHLLGEAKFLRAFYYFYLVNLFGDVPLLTTSDIQLNSNAGRTSKDVVYEQIIKDLKDAQSLLSNEYFASDAITPINDRFRPNRFAVEAILSRVYLYTQKWSLAESSSSDVINQSDLYKIENINNTFLGTSKETIWQMQSRISTNTVGTFYYTQDASQLILYNNTTPVAPGTFGHYYYLSKQLYDSFEPGDLRKKNWIDSITIGGKTYPFAFKYKQYGVANSSTTEHLIVLRLAEQYLIRAEARANLGNLTGAASDLNIIRNRAGLPNVTITNQPALLNDIYVQRRSEFFTEFGHRWFDLKRTGLINQVMNTAILQKGGTWSAYKALYPIPISEFTINPKIKGQQNPGYPEQ